MHRPDYLSGVIEGFYGRPWTHEQRLALFPRLAAWGMNTYVYGPKDDIKVRARWRERYDADEARRLGELVAGCRAAGVRFVYAVAPGLDMRYSEGEEVDRLVHKVDQLVDLGVHDVAVLFDDIPHALDPAAADRFGGFAEAQAHVTEALFRRLRGRAPDGRRIFCPTDYCTRMAEAAERPWAYLADLGARLADDVDVFWTGDEIVSERISAADVARVTDVLRRPPTIWDNLHANDYDLRRLYLGPVAGRAGDLVGATRGLLTNPNNQLEANEVAFATLAAYVRDPAGYDADEALDEALAHWRPRLELDGGGTLSEHELRLVVELLYLPWRCGERVEALLGDARSALDDSAGGADAHERVGAFAAEVASTFARLTELRDRDLLYALYPFVWEARTESRALADALRHRARYPSGGPPFGRPAQLANTYRRGFAASVQALLPVGDDGRVRFGAAPPPAEGTR